jgi:hypothetical protein
VIAAIDWTSIIAVVAGGSTAILGGLVTAIFGTRAVKHQEAAASERAALKRAETSKAERRALYLRLVVAERDVWAKVRNHPRAPPEEMRSWVVSLFEPVTGVLLSGNASVATAAVKLHMIVQRTWVVGQAREGTSPDAEWTDLVDVQWRAATRELIDAMRSDVAADGAPVAWTSAGARDVPEFADHVGR